MSSAHKIEQQAPVSCLYQLFQSSQTTGNDQLVPMTNEMDWRWGGGGGREECITVEFFSVLGHKSTHDNVDYEQHNCICLCYDDNDEMVMMQYTMPGFG